MPQLQILRVQTQKFQAHNNQQTTLLMALATEIQAKEKSGLLKIMVLGKIKQQVNNFNKSSGLFTDFV
jgi:hypothetical protein